MQEVAERDQVAIKHRSVALAILFSIITFGIYAIYWYVCLTNDTNKLSPRYQTANGGLAILFTIISFGIYGYYWSYKLGQKVGDIENEGSSPAIVYLLLQIIGLGIIDFALAQSALNKKATY